MAFKMKGSPFHRNYGIGSPAKQATLSTVSDSLQSLPNPAAEKLRKEYEAAQKKLQEDAQKNMDANTDSTNTANQAELNKRAKQIAQNVSPKELNKQIDDLNEKNSPAKQTYDVSGTDERAYKVDQDKYDAWRKGKDAPDVRYVGQQKNKKHLEDYLKHKESLPKGKGQTNRERILQDKIDFQKKKSPAKQTTSDKVKRPNLYDGKPKNGKPDSYNGPRSKGGVIKTTNYKPKGPRDGMKVTETKKYGKSKGEHTKSKSPAKCPLLALAPAAIAAVGAMKKNKEE